MALDDAVVRFQAGAVELEGNLSLPFHTQGLVIFAHGSGSGRRSPRNRFVASELNHAGLGTLLFDLLTVQEEQVDRMSREFRFDVALLSRRLTAAVDWATHTRLTTGLPIGLFGASTGAAAAVLTAAQRPDAVSAVVSRGGRPDLAAAALPHLRAPVLLLVGGEDTQVIALNQAAARSLRAPVRLHLIPGATHLFEEPGALEEVARLASGFFAVHLGGDRTHERTEPAPDRDLHHIPPSDLPPAAPPTLM
jgi:dienelactone hydrolase